MKIGREDWQHLMFVMTTDGIFLFLLTFVFLLRFCSGIEANHHAGPKTLLLRVGIKERESHGGI